jgi:2'-5' RNA ligase
LASSEVRLFAGVFPSGPTLEKLRAVTEAMKAKYANGRFVAPAKQHITLRFFGDVEIDVAIERVQRAVYGIQQFNIELDHIGAFPRLGSARVLYCGAVYNADFHAMMERAGEQRGVAHLTLARFKSHQSVNHEAIDPIAVPVDRVLLINSVLGGTSHYEVVRGWDIP